MARHTLRTRSRSARPMVAFARHPGPKHPALQFTSRCNRAGPLITTACAAPDNVPVTLWQLPFSFRCAAHRGDHHRHVLRSAAGHHRVDGGVLGGDDDLAGRHRAEHDVGGELRGLEELRHRLRRGRHDRQTVGPAPGVVVLEQLGVVAVLVGGCMERAHRRDPRALRRSVLVGSVSAVPSTTPST